MAVELKLSRADRVYRPSENLEGTIIITSSSPISHHGIKITIKGAVNLQVRSGVAGVIDSLYGSVKPIKIMNKCVDVSHSRKLGAGKTLVPFSIALASPGSDEFFETFHGENISIQYLITADVIRGYLHKPLSTTIEFIIESDRAKLMEMVPSPETVSFYITQDTQSHQLLPELFSGGFRVSGKMVTECTLLNPLTGDLTVEASAAQIESIDVQLLRVESILVGEKFISETSVIQTTQVADGDVCRSLMLPIYIIIPRLLTCPTVLAGPFSIEFQVSIVITFRSELSKLYPKADLRTPKPWLAMQTLPLRLVRTK
ncbi:unnamed protein product [Victoria cruziana]